MIPASGLFDQSTITALLDHDPVVQNYHAFFLCAPYGFDVEQTLPPRLLAAREMLPL